MALKSRSNICSLPVYTLLFTYSVLLISIIKKKEQVCEEKVKSSEVIKNNTELCILCKYLPQQMLFSLFPKSTTTTTRNQKSLHFLNLR